MIRNRSSLKRGMYRAIFALLVGSVAPALAQESGPVIGAFGLPGAIEMPDATSLRDGEIALTYSRFASEPRQALSFQITPRLTGVFRYSRFGESDVGTPWDRSFSIHYKILEESRWLPAVVVGLADITGTSLYSSEYLVFAKSLTPELRVTTGIGWGRLGSFGGGRNPLGVLSGALETRPQPDIGKGGSFDPGVWFRGDAALFGALQWSPRDDLRFVLEYSSDAYTRQDGRMFERNSPFNVGVDYRVTDRLTASARYLYGSEVGIQLTYLFSPYQRPRLGAGVEEAPPALVSGKPEEVVSLNQFRARLKSEGITLVSSRRDGSSAVVIVENNHYRNDAQAIGRTARVMYRSLPEEVSTYRVILQRRGLLLSETRISRSDLLAEEFGGSTSVDGVGSIRSPALDERSLTVEQTPKFDIGVEPFVRPALFDPDNPIRAAGGVRLGTEVRLFPGFYLNASLERRLIGNLGDSSRESTSVLPKVRSNSNLYDREGDLSLSELTVSKYFQPAESVYGRVTAGYLERMFGGISGEVMWKPDGRPYSVSAEVSWVRQRDFDQDLGFQDYSVTIGQLSLDYQFTDEYVGRLSVGRYLAGDFGGTIELGRKFRNGWKVSAFATLTDVSFEEFGEGSFDKGITVNIPLDWLDGKPSRRTTEVVLRPVLRDGGAQLEVPRRLHEVLDGGTPSEISNRWSRFWR